MKSKNEEFLNGEPTVNFITLFNNLFDIINTKSKYDFGFKGPLNKQNITLFFNFFATSEKYLRGLKLSREILKSQSKTEFLEYLIAINNFRCLYEEYIVNDKLEYLVGFTFSQDHIETFFSVIRLRGR